MTIRLLACPLVGFSLASAEVTLRVGPADHPGPDHLTLSAAFEKLLALRAAGDTSPATLLLAPGFHHAPPPVTPELAGLGLTLAAADPSAEHPVVSAGTVITDWTEVDGLWSAPLATEPAALFVGDRRAIPARAPNDGFWRIEKTGPDRRGSFTWQSDTIPAIQDTASLGLVFLHDWSTTQVPVRNLDPATRTLSTRFPIGPHADHYRIDHFEKQPRFFLTGSRDFLDSPGEWYYESRSKTVLYQPRPGESPARSPAIASTLGHALVLRGTAGAPLRGIRLKHLVFSHADWMPADRRYAAGQAGFHEEGEGSEIRVPIPCAVEADFCHDLLIEDCRFIRSSGGGLWVREGCSEVAIRGSVFRDLGANGLMIGETGNPKKPTRKVTVEHSLIEDCGTRFPGAVGVWIGIAAECTIRDNEIRNLPYTGLSLGWRWSATPSACRDNLVENNHIHHVLLTLSDGGGIYTLGHQPGSILRGNHIHDVRVNAGRAESNGIFMDQGSTAFLVEANDIHDIARSPIRFHQAGKNTLRRNKLRPGPGIPSLRFNATPEENIQVEEPR